MFSGSSCHLLTKPATPMLLPPSPLQTTTNSSMIMVQEQPPNELLSNQHRASLGTCVKTSKQLGQQGRNYHQMIPETSRWNKTAQFPWKMHRMLEDAELEGFAHLVSWMPDDQAFRVHDNDTFVQQVLPLYFEQTQYKSFQRQLNMWGFERVTEGANYGAYTHQFFVRGQADLCKQMKRLKIKGNNRRRKNAPASSMPFIKKNKVMVPRFVSPMSPKLVVSGELQSSTIAALSPFGSAQIPSNSLDGTETSLSRGVAPLSAVLEVDGLPYNTTSFCLEQNFPSSSVNHDRPFSKRTLSTEVEINVMFFEMTCLPPTSDTGSEGHGDGEEGEMFINSLQHTQEPQEPQLSKSAPCDDHLQQQHHVGHESTKEEGTLQWQMIPEPTPLSSMMRHRRQISRRYSLNNLLRMSLLEDPDRPNTSFIFS